jgi:phage-related tail protein
MYDQKYIMPEPDWDYAEKMTIGNRKAYLRKKMLHIWHQLVDTRKRMKAAHNALAELRSYIEEGKETTKQLQLIKRIVGDMK